MKTGCLAVAIVVFVILLVIVGGGALIGISINNEIIKQDENVKALWAKVESQYQRRYDLIPNIVASVQGEANFEKSTLTAVTEARSQMGGVIKIDENMLGDEQAMKAFQEKQATLGGALQRLMAVTENYPDLKSNAGFKDLRVELEGTENRIAVARNDYNEGVKNFNYYIRKFPNSIVAGFSGATPKVLFSADPGTNAAPKVDFNIK